MSCERKFYWRHVRHLSQESRLIIPEFGIAIHKALESWYEAGHSGEAISLFQDSWRDDEGERNYTRRNGEALLNAYFKLRGKFNRDIAPESFKALGSEADKYYSPAEPFTFLGLEQAFACPIEDSICPKCSTSVPEVLTSDDLANLERGDVRCRSCSHEFEIDIYCGRFDGVIQWGDLTLVIDHKTTGKLGDGSYYFKQFRPNLQMSGYVWAAEKIFGRRVHGVLINVLHMTTRTVNFARDISSRESFEIERFKSIVKAQIALAKSKGQDYADWPENWTSCMDFRGCPYRELCLTEDPERLVDSMYRVNVWSPLNHSEGEKDA